MKAHRILRSLTFRLALIYLGIFALSIAFLLALAWWAFVHTPLAQVREMVETEARTLARLYDPTDPARLIERLQTRVETPGHRHAFHVLETPAGTALATNLPRWPDAKAEPWLHFELEEFEWHGGQEREVLAYDIRLPDGARLLVGRDTEDIDDRGELLEDALSWGAGATLVLGLLGGILMSLAVGKRIEALARMARRVMAGDLSGRVALRGAGDDFDRLGETLNEMLSRIETLFQSVSRVSDSIAHELRTPLTRLHTNLESLVQGLETADPEQRQLAENALREGVRLQTTFDALLRIARIETGRHEAARSSVNLARLLEDAVDLYEPSAENRGQAIRLDAASDLRVDADPNLLFQAVSNLLDNAIKYSAPSSIINVSTHVENGMANITTRDHGPGIPDKDRTHVTERFYRVRHPEGPDGLGLGLSLVEAVARLHRGDLLLENADPGLRATLRLPLASRRSTGDPP